MMMMMMMMMMMVFCTQVVAGRWSSTAETQTVCTVWRVLLEQYPPHRTHRLSLGSAGPPPGNNLGAGNHKL
jgi:hypothetical protein